MRIKELSKQALTVFHVLTADIHAVGNHVRFDNGSFMPVAVECVSTTPTGCLIVSIAHYYEQNGDLMVDPEVTFCVTKNDDYVFPTSYRQDGLGVDRECVWWEKEKVFCNFRMQNDLAGFCATWMRNIKQQQFNGKLPKLVTA
jgi:hypothetical protein